MPNKTDLYKLLSADFQKAIDAAAGQEEQVRPRMKVYFAISSIKDPLELLKDPYLPSELHRRLTVTKTDEPDFFVMNYRYGTKSSNFYVVMTGSIWAIYTIAARWVVDRSINRILLHSPQVSGVWLPPPVLQRIAESYGGSKNIYSFTSKFSPFMEDIEQGIEGLTVRLWGRKASNHMQEFDEEYNAKPSRISFDIVTSNPGVAKVAVASEGYVLLDSGELSAFAAVANSYDGIVQEITKQLAERGTKSELIQTGVFTNTAYHLGRPLIINLSKPLGSDAVLVLKEMFTKGDLRTRFAGYVDHEDAGFLSINAVDLTNRDGLVNIRNTDGKTLNVTLLGEDNPRTLQRVYRLIVDYFDPNAASEISKTQETSPSYMVQD